MDDRNLKRFYIVYLISAILFCTTLSAAVVVHRYSSEMRDTVDNLRTLSGSSVKVRRATESAYQSTARIKEQIPAAYLSSPVENVIFQAVDTIRQRAKNAEVTVDSIQDKGDEMDLPIAIKGPLGDYSEFLRMVHFLESLRFPFFTTNELIMTRETDSAVSGYELRGVIRTLKTPAIHDTPSRPRRSS